VNDIYDFQIDEISNPERPLQKKIFTIRQYAELGIVIFLLFFLGGLTVSAKFAAILSSIRSSPGLIPPAIPAQNFRS
jgi:4-hydroxybenzoate polyprenyltransferase